MGSRDAIMSSVDEPITVAKPVIGQCPLLGDFRIEGANQRHQSQDKCKIAEEASDRAERRASAEAFKKAGLIDVLSRLEGEFKGPGYNMIFRPMNSVNPTTQFKDKELRGNGERDNVLELNLTKEHWTFTRDLGEVPNRGLFEQGDIDLHGLSYIQRVADVGDVDSGEPTGCPRGIHFEPGLIMFVPAVNENPIMGPTISRMASIPHGTTISLQGHAPTTDALVHKAPKFDDVSITPFFIGKDPIKGQVKPPFLSQTVTEQDTPRLPQNLDPFVLANTINQTIMNNPNEVLRRANVGKNIIDSFAFKLSSNKIDGLTGGGITNIPFLEGKPDPNAKVKLVESTFWISTVSYEVELPRFTPCSKHEYLDLQPPIDPVHKHPVPTFRLTRAVEEPRKISVAATQFQYSQMVVLDFAPLSWPHVSVATLLPAQPLVIPEEN